VVARKRRAYAEAAERSIIVAVKSCAARGAGARVIVERRRRGDGGRR
jgi:hypothetical protein